MTLSLRVTPTQEKRCDSRRRRELRTRVSDRIHLSLALQTTMVFFLYCPVFTFLIMFAYTNIQLGWHFINTAPGRDERKLCSGREQACDYSSTVEVILQVDNPNTDHRQIITFQINLSSSLCF